MKTRQSKNRGIPSDPGNLSRRSFLRASGVTLAGTAVFSSLASGQRARAADGAAPLKLALVGCGGRGAGAANEALNTQGYNLVAVADAFQDRLEGCLNSLRERHPDRVDVPPERMFVGFDAFKQAIAACDVVLLATPPGFRPIHFEEAVRQGKHVFMEKPLAVDGPGVRQVLATGEAAKAKGLKIVVGLQRRYEPGYQETVKRLQDGQIGDLVAMRCYWNGSGVWVNPRKPEQTEMEHQMRNWYYFTWLSGDHIVEQHIHNLDVINWVKNAFPTECQGMGGRQVRIGKDYGEIFDHHAVEFTYEDGSRLFSYCRHIPGCWNSVSEHVIGTKGRCDVGGHRITGDKPWRFTPPEKVMDPYQAEHVVLLESIRNNRPINNTEYGANSTLTAIMGRMATYSGKVVTWQQALDSNLDLMPKVFAWDAQPPVLPGDQGAYPIAVPGKTVTV